MKKILVALIMFVALGVNAQSEKDTLVKWVETIAEFPGGESAMHSYLQKQLVYPAADRKKGVTGKVVVQFTVDTVGGIRDVKVVRSATPDMDAEVIRVVSAMPRWKPATQNNKPVNLRYTLPITFNLENADMKKAELLGIIAGGLLGMAASLWLISIL